MKSCVQISLTLALVSACDGSFGFGDREPRDASISRDTGHVDSGPRRDAQPGEDAGAADGSLRPADRCEGAQLFPAGRYVFEFGDAQDDTQDWGASCSP